MKTKLLKALVLKNKQRGAAALLLFLCLLSFAIAPASAQVQKQKRITALQLGEAAEGSRVTIVSDSGLGDYEAFRRGDWFYVKIPLAEFKSATPHCCASGFENVQVQRVGDSVIISFRLQAGATARVDHRSNRLDVIFSSPTKAFRNNTANVAANRVATGTNVSRTAQNRGPDAAGPMPPGSAPVFPQRLVTEGARAVSDSRAPQNPRFQPNLQTSVDKVANKQTTSGINQPSTVKDHANTSNAANGLPSPAPYSSPANSVNYPALNTATPATPASSQPATSSTSSGSPSAPNWKSRGRAALQWVSTNRLATLLGVLIFLSLILYLATALSRRRKLTTAKRANVAKVQPKLTSDAHFDELTGPAPLTSPTASKLSTEFVRQPTVAAPKTQNHSWVLPVASPSAGHKRSGDEEEREVFEL